MLTQDERRKKYREHWMTFVTTFAVMDDIKSAQMLAAKCTPWVGQAGFLGTSSTPHTRALFAAAKWWLFTRRSLVTQAHTVECIHQYASTLDLLLEMGDEIEVFEKKYPRFCYSCGGNGFIEIAGDRYTPSGVEPCDDCLGNCRCPLCNTFYGEQWDGESCNACGWTYETVIALPSYEDIQLECICGMGA